MKVSVCVCPFDSVLYPASLFSVYLPFPSLSFPPLPPSAFPGSASAAPHPRKRHYEEKIRTEMRMAILTITLNSIYELFC